MEDRGIRTHHTGRRPDKFISVRIVWSCELQFNVLLLLPSNLPVEQGTLKISHK